MGLNDSILKDITEALDELSTQCHTDKIQTLKLLLEKYVHKNKVDHLMGYHDLHTIIGDAKNNMVKNSFPKFLEYGSFTKQVLQEYQVHLCLIEATIEHLNRLECFKRLPKFNYKENKF